MKIKILQASAGVGFVRNIGDEIEVDDAEAVRLIEADQAEPVREASPVETAVARPVVERAVSRKRKG